MKIRIFFLMCIGLFSVSCGGGLASSGMETNEFAQTLSEFISYNNFDIKSTDTLSDDVYLYIDYSTCVAEAKNSEFYRTVHPVIVDANPNYYSIKGKTIAFETNNRQIVYQLLNTVREINYAEIKGAVDSIVHGNHHAVLITDGEYYMQNGVQDNLNNPYIAEEFRVWLRRGFDIYVYSEPYLEYNYGKPFSKYRYYFFFTDDNVDNNIRERFHRSMPQNNDVKLFHLSGKLPIVDKGEGYPVINQSLSPNTMLKYAGPRYDMQEYYTGWSKIYKYILDNAYSETGEKLEKGDYLVRGLFLNNGSENAFKVSDLDVRVYNLGEAFEKYKTELINEEEHTKAGRLTAYKLFDIDKELFEQTGEIALRLNNDNRYDGLLSTPNLLKVDIVVTSLTENFTQNNEINDRFQWQSISGAQAGKFNTSLYESIRQILLDPTMNPVNIDGTQTLYTIYMSTYGL